MSENSIVTLDPKNAAEAVSESDKPITLTSQIAAEMRVRALRLRDLVHTRIRTPALDAEQEALAQALAGFLLTFSIPLLESYLTMHAEYRPLVNALQPVFARIAGATAAAMQQPQRPPGRLITPELDKKVDSAPAG